MDTLKSALASYIAKKVLAFITSKFAFALVPPWGLVISWLVPLVINWAVDRFSNPEKSLNTRSVYKLESAIKIDMAQQFRMDHPKI